MANTNINEPNTIATTGVENKIITSESLKYIHDKIKREEKIELDKKANQTEVTALKEDLTKLHNIYTKEYLGILNSVGDINPEAPNKEIHTEFIAVMTNEVIHLEHVLDKNYATWVGVALYDENINFLKRDVLANNIVTNAYKYSYTVPENVKFIRVIYRSFGTRMKIFRSVNFENTISDISKNLVRTNSAMSMLDFNTIGYLGNNGTVVNDSTHGERSSSYTPVVEGEKYTFVSAIPTGKPHWMCICEYDESTKFIQRIVNTEITYLNLCGKDYGIMEYTVPANVKYLRFSTRTFDSDLRFIGKSDSNIVLCFKELMEINKQQIFKSKLANINMNTVNHRGYNTVAPENTLSAFKLSKKMGFDIVETDVSFTSDGVPVLLHDNTVDRTSDGTGEIDTLTLEQVKALDFGSWKDAKYTGEKIPTFEEFLLLCKQIGLKAYVEIKGGATERQVKQLVDLSRKYGMDKSITWASFAYVILNYVKNNDDKARLGYVTNDITQNTIDNAKLLKTQCNEVFIDADHNKLTDQTVELCINSKFPLEVWTVNSASALNAINPYVSGITTDSILVNEVLYNENV